MSDTQSQSNVSHEQMYLTLLAQQLEFRKHYIRKRLSQRCERMQSLENQLQSSLNQYNNISNLKIFKKKVVRLQIENLEKEAKELVREQDKDLSELKRLEEEI